MTELANEGSETSLRASAFDSQDLMSSFSYSPNNDTQCVGWDPLKYKGSASSKYNFQLYIPIFLFKKNTLFLGR